MIVLDANYILRYLLRDEEKMFLEAKEVIANERCLLLNEVLAEVVYVLQGVYKTPKNVIAQTLSAFVSLESMVTHESKTAFVEALHIYSDKNIDYVDATLCALKDKYKVKSFDKKLMKCVNRYGLSKNT